MTNPNNTFPPLTYDNLSGRPPEEGVPIVVAPMLEWPTSLISEVGVQEGSHVIPLVEPDNGKSNSVAGPLGSGKATYASVIDKGSSESKPSDTEYD
ncbi:hypothetical protein V6N13_148733 [Hibiscus sabdariffa]